MVTVTTSADIMGVLKTRVTWSIFGAYSILISNGGGCRSNSSLTCRISSSTLFIIVRYHFGDYIFALSNLRTIFHAVCLLDEEHVAMILRSFYDLWASSAVLDVHSETLVWLRTDGSVVVGTWRVGDTHVILMSVLVLWSRRSSIGSPESTKSWWVHLLLQQVARVCIMDIWGILKSLDQIRRITWTASVSIERATGSSFVIEIYVLNVPDARLSRSWWWTLVGKLSLGVLKQLIDVAGIFILWSFTVELTLVSPVTFPALSVFIILDFVWIIRTCLDRAML